MAVLSNLVTTVRRRVADFDAPQVYDDAFYNEAIEDLGLPRVNIDLGSAYTVGTLLQKYELLLVYRGAIEMCYVRGAEGATNSAASATNDPIQSIAVPNMSISKMVKARKGPDYWLELAARLEAAYLALLDKLMESGEVDTPAIQQQVISRRSWRTGRRTDYRLDRALAAPDLALAEAAGVVTLSWAPVYDVYFEQYKIERSSVSSFATYSTVSWIADNHTDEYSESPGSGTWYYRIAVVNSNGLHGRSSAATVTI